VPILGTSPDAIDLAEDRDRFKRVLDKLRLKQPKNGIAYSVEQARLVAERSRLPAGRPPVLCARRPRHADHSRRTSSSDYMLGTLPELVPADVKARYPNDKTGQINTVLGKNPLLFDRYLSDATEVDVDCLCDGKDVFVVGIMEHIEEAGIHSGDSACSLPPHSLDAATIAELERQTRELALGLEVVG
jgi:carbamoyl-phosphate synthase large subunit